MRWGIFVSGDRFLNISNWFFKYAVYYPVVLVRGEWIANHLEALEKTQYLPVEDIEQLQLERLNKLLKHARATVPYYVNIPTSSLTSLERLQDIPLLEKEALRNCADQFYSSKTGILTRYKTTGGSTGAPVTLRKDSQGMAHELAATWRGYRWAGIDVGHRQARFWGVPADNKGYLRARIIDFVSHRKRLSAFSFSSSDLAMYLSELKRFKPDYFYGYVSMIRQFADYIDKEGKNGVLKPNAIITTAEALTKVDRQQIESVFECKVFNEYGCGELGTIAHECEHGKLHISAENMIVEILGDDGSPARVGEPGEIVVTDLVNYSTPLIRYRLKDYATMSNRPCPCGRQLPVVLGVHGREYDMLVNSEGKKFHGEFFLYLVEDLKKENISIDKCQFVQNKMEINIRISYSGNLSVDYFQNYFLTKLKARFDPNVKVLVNFVSDIPRERSGKLRTVIRES